MIRVSRTGASAPAATRRVSKASGEFRVEGGAKAAGTNAAGPAAPVETLSALIALQSGGEGAGRRAKTIAAAQRALDILDCLHRDLLEGVVSTKDLDRLAEIASANVIAPEVDERLVALYDEIALRARVELAKRGR